jgi:hypothetical protein
MGRGAALRFVVGGALGNSPAKEGRMEKPAQLMLEALGRAALEPAGAPLVGSRLAPGLFPATPPGKQAAQRSIEQGYLRVLRTENRGKLVHEICAVTEKGLAYLLSQVSPRQVLEDLVRALEARQSQVSDLVTAARQTQTTLEALRAVAEKVLLGSTAETRPGPSVNGSETWKASILSCLTQWSTGRASDDCPLPELFRQAQQTAAALTIGRFHDGLRFLHDRGQIYLHPWTGPLYDLPEPVYALLAGHEIVYYASLRK